MSRKMLYLQFTNPGHYPPLEYSSRILADEGWEVFFLGVHSDAPRVLEHAPHPRIGTDLLRYTAAGWRHKLAYVHFLQRAFRFARTWKPDWIYVSDYLTTPVGWLLSRTLGCKAIYHEHDSPPPRKVSSWFLRIALTARRAFARTAKLNIVPQRERLRLFIQETGTTQPVLCVWNCPLKAEATDTTTARERRRDEPLAIYFHGSINLDRVPLALIEGARLCGFPVRLRIAGYETIGSRGASEQLRAAAAMAGPTVLLELPGAIPLRDDLRRLMDGMHVGWINFINRSDDLNLRHLAGASNKAFDYLAAGLPIIVPDDPGWMALFVEPGYGRACTADDPRAIAATLRWFYDNAAEAAQMGRRGQQKVAAVWNYESQFRPVLAALNSGG